MTFLTIDITDVLTPEALAQRVVEAVAELPDLDRARVARLMASHETAAGLGSLGDATVYGMTRRPGATYATVAADLGVSPNTVLKAVKRARKRATEQGSTQVTGQTCHSTPGALPA
jgi:hypothetical protein